MNPRAKRKPVVIRVSLGARARARARARSPHYSWFIQTRAARFYYFLVTSWRRTRGRASLSCCDITVTTTVSTLSISVSPVSLCRLFSLFSSSVHVYASLFLPRCGCVRDAPEKLHVQTTMTLLSARLPSTAYGTSPRSFRRERDFSGDFSTVTS